MWYNGNPQATLSEFHYTTLRVQYLYTLENHSTTITYYSKSSYNIIIPQGHNNMFGIVSDKNFTKKTIWSIDIVLIPFSLAIVAFVLSPLMKILNETQYLIMLST